MGYSHIDHICIFALYISPTPYFISYHKFYFLLLLLLLHFVDYIYIIVTMPEAPKINNVSEYDCCGSNSSLDAKNKKALQFIEDVTSNADEVQRRVLAEILSRSAHVEYLQRHGLNGCTDQETFKKVVPVVTYEDLKPEIDRIANGDASPILCSQPISEFLTR